MHVPTVVMNDENSIPQIGYGVWKISDEDADKAVMQAIKTGYRHIDTAQYYDNETGVGKGIAGAGLQRGEIFVTTKLWNTEHGYDATLKAFDASLKRLATEYIDLYLIHWPVPQHDLFVETWKAMIRLKQEGRVKSIGVSNFRMEDLERLIQETDVAPALNQIELHPAFQQHALRQYHKQHHIATEAWSPLGQGKFLTNPTLETIAQAHHKSVAQIILRWHIEIGNIVIPKSQSPERMAENFDIFNFELRPADHDTIAKLDQQDGRIGQDPATFYQV